MAENGIAMAEEYIIGTHGRLIYLHFGEETEEEKAERQALLLRVADSLGVAVLRPRKERAPHRSSGARPKYEYVCGRIPVFRSRTIRSAGNGFRREEKPRPRAGAGLTPIIAYLRKSLDVPP